MQVYLPIAEVSVNVFLLVGLGGAIGFLSGLFGVGGGFVGSYLGVELFAWLRTVGQIDLVIRLSFVFFLGIIGTLMLVESSRAILRQRSGTTVRRKLHQHYWVHRLPLRMRFRKSKLYISAIPPFAIGALVGVLAAIMGVGRGFLMVPAMIYLLGMATIVVVGTSLFQIIFVTANVTFLQSVTTQTVDVVLALRLLAGAVVGAQFGSRAGQLLRGEQLRGLLALIVLAVVAKLVFDLVATPDDVFSLGVPGSH